jgi:two-component system, OmpR family, response regulator
MLPVKVLVADDNIDAADSLAMLVEANGGEAVACYDGPSALIEAGRFRPDVCLLDLTMPGMDGDQVAARVRELDPGRRVALVAVTALGSEEARKRTERAGFDLHLVKPVDPDQILSAVYTLGGPSGPATRPPAAR